MTNRVTALATVRVKHVLGELFGAGSGFDHAIQLGASLSWLCRCGHDAKKNSQKGQSHVTGRLRVERREQALGRER